MEISALMNGQESRNRSSRTAERPNGFAHYQQEAHPYQQYHHSDAYGNQHSGPKEFYGGAQEQPSLSPAPELRSRATSRGRGHKRQEQQQPLHQNHSHDYQPSFDRMAHDAHARSTIRADITEENIIPDSRRHTGLPFSSADLPLRDQYLSTPYKDELGRWRDNYPTPSPHSPYTGRESMGNGRNSIGSLARNGTQRIFATPAPSEEQDAALTLMSLRGDASSVEFNSPGREKEKFVFSSDVEETNDSDETQAEAQQAMAQDYRPQYTEFNGNRYPANYHQQQPVREVQHYHPQSNYAASNGYRNHYNTPSQPNGQQYYQSTPPQPVYAEEEESYNSDVYAKGEPDDDYKDPDFDAAIKRGLDPAIKKRGTQTKKVKPNAKAAGVRRNSKNAKPLPQLKPTVEAPILPAAKHRKTNNSTVLALGEPMIPSAPPTPSSAATGGASKPAAPEKEKGPRCQRCRKSKKGCDRQRPCGRCKDAGIPDHECISEDETTSRRGRQAGGPRARKPTTVPIAPTPDPTLIKAPIPPNQPAAVPTPGFLMPAKVNTPTTTTTTTDNNSLKKRKRV